jgi:hypothetical protein
MTSDNSLMRRAARPFLLLLSVSLFSAACSDAVTDPPALASGEFTVDASNSWTYVSLSDSAVVTPVAPREAGDWDIAFFATNVTLNGGAAGPSGVTGACICQNEIATNAEILAMTAASEKDAFDAVTAVPPEATFESDALTPAFSAWYTGTGAAAAADPSRVFLVRLSDGTSFAKVHVTGITGATATSFGTVTLEYAVQTSATAAFAATKTITVSTDAAVDLNTDAVTTSPTAWDVRLEGAALLVNSGVSGPGAAGVADGTDTFANTTTASTQPQAYRTDRYAGIFGSSPWYRYNIAGDNRISPTFDVYLVKRGSAVYKMQIINYYSASGAPRHITFRYQQIAS